MLSFIHYMPIISFSISYHPLTVTLDEDEYVDSIRSIVKRDFFEENEILPGESYKNVDAHPDLDQFLATHTSEDNYSFNLLQKKDEDIRRLKLEARHRGFTAIKDTQVWEPPQLLLGNDDEFQANCAIAGVNKNDVLMLQDSKLQFLH